MYHFANPQRLESTSNPRHENDWKVWATNYTTGLLYAPYGLVTPAAHTSTSTAMFQQAQQPAHNIHASVVEANRYISSYSVYEQRIMIGPSYLTYQKCLAPTFCSRADRSSIDHEQSDHV